MILALSESCRKLLSLRVLPRTSIARHSHQRDVACFHETRTDLRAADLTSDARHNKS
jgi:hypothetical protein